MESMQLFFQGRELLMKFRLLRVRPKLGHLFCQGVGLVEDNPSV
jgi:hypothetical protein